MKSILVIMSLVGLLAVDMTSLSLFNLPGLKLTLESLSTLSAPQLLDNLLPVGGRFRLIPWVGPSDPDFGKTTPEIIEERGWGVQLHYPVTPDGYILGVHRIVNPNGNPLKGKPVILQHGLLSSSICWVLNDPNNGFYGEDPCDEDVGGNLGFELAKRGYDVWLTNTRGNIYSRNHISLSPNNPQFWNYSFDEMIKYDVPTVINHVKDVTRSVTVGWVGHSQGTVLMFGFLSRNPCYSNVINPFVALAPVAYASYMGGPIGILLRVPLIGTALQALPGRFPPLNLNLPALLGLFCQGNIPEYLCSQSNYLLMGGGFNTTNMNETRQGVYQKNDSLDSSDKTIAHYIFNGSKGKFQSFDYQLGNLAKYGSLTPPQYDLSKITCPNIAIISSSGDYLADPIDVKHLLRDLKVKLLANWYINDEQFSHLNFVYGLTTGSVVNSKVISVFENKICV